jgi:hypothetical protein
MHTHDGFHQPSVISPNGDLVAFENVHQNCDDQYCWSNVATAPRRGFTSQDVTHNSIKHPFRFATEPSWQPLQP